MEEMDPIVKTICLVLTAAAIFIIVLIVFAKNNPVFAQTLLNSICNVTDTVTGYNPIPTHT
jgi:hypothetical protein